MARNKKYAFLVAYNGKGYHGCQFNRDTETVEKAFVDALVATGAVKVCNNDPAKISLQRCSRTDAGVHAALNVFVAKTSEEPRVADLRAFFATRGIHVFDAVRVPKSFLAQRACDSRVYEYFIPAFALAPGTYASDRDAPAWDFALAAPDLRGLENLLQNYVGTRDYRNFTSAKNERGTLRHIKSVAVAEPLARDGVFYVKVTFHGQSFLYNQIRKMIAHAVECVRYGADFDAPFGTAACRVLVAPSQFLLLERPVFDSYNERGGHAPIRVGDDVFAAVKDALVYAEVLDRRNVAAFAEWLGHAATVRLGNAAD